MMSIRRLIIVTLILASMIGGCFGVETYKENQQQNQLIHEFETINGYDKTKIERYLSIYNNSDEKMENIVILVNNDIDLINVNRRLALKLIEDKYYIKKNLYRYINHFLNGEFYDIRTLVATVNAGADQTPYTNTVETDLSKNELILCNRYNYLPDKYYYGELVEVEEGFATVKNVKMSLVAYEAYKELKENAEAEGNKILINGNNAYRSYQKQQEAFDGYVKSYDMETALAYAAKPGYSEHQTGLAVDVLFNYKNSESYRYEDYRWLLDNSWKYGFIVRYPKGKEKITNNDYEPWHYRYVGKEAAKFIYENDITFDEYYNYFLVDNEINVEDFVKMFQ